MIFSTRIKAVDQEGNVNLWVGPYIRAISWGDAEAKCEKLYPYAYVYGLLWSDQDEDGKNKKNFVFWN